MRVRVLTMTATGARQPEGHIITDRTGATYIVQANGAFRRCHVTKTLGGGKAEVVLRRKR